MKKQRVVIAGLGDTGLLSAIRLSRHYEVIGISPKPCLVSGQELGMRLTRPELWRREYLMPFAAYKKLDGVKILQGQVTAMNRQHNDVVVQLSDGSTQTLHYDVLLIASGVSNGFWRTPHMEDADSVEQQLEGNARLIEEHQNIAIVGAGATGVSSAVNIASKYPDKVVNLFYAQEQVLPGYHPAIRKALEKQLTELGVCLHPGHRAQLGDDIDCSELGSGSIHWETGQEPFEAELILWAIGQLRPNNQFVESSLLNASGFVRTDARLRVQGCDNIFCVGDIAATDPNRCSARNGGYALVAKNIRYYLQGRSGKMKEFKPPRYRWGSITGVQDSGLTVYDPKGGSFRFSASLVKHVLFPIIVRRLMYKGVRQP